MAKKLTDDELNLKRKARRRLIGAVALTLVVVVVLPMVLDSEPQPTGQDIDLRIPAPDKVGEFVPGVAVSEVADTSSFAASAVSADPTVTTTHTGSVQAVDTSHKVTVAETVTADAPSQTPPSSVESYAVQVGAYANAETARQELTRLKKWGFKAYTEKVDDKTRVRVGPYEQREKAEKVRVMLEKHDLHPVITNAQ